MLLRGEVQSSGGQIRKKSQSLKNGPTCGSSNSSLGHLSLTKRDLFKSTMAHLSPSKVLAKIFTKTKKLTPLDVLMCMETLFQELIWDHNFPLQPLTSLFSEKTPHTDHTECHFLISEQDSIQSLSHNAVHFIMP